jgi:hypothetical protein
MHLSKFVHTQTGKIIASIILGFGLASLFRTVCEGKNCSTIMAPEDEKVSGKIFQHGSKCYKYTTNTVQCNKN